MKSCVEVHMCDSIFAQLKHIDEITYPSPSNLQVTMTRQVTIHPKQRVLRPVQADLFRASIWKCHSQSNDPSINHWLRTCPRMMVGTFTSRGRYTIASTPRKGTRPVSNSRF